MDFFTPPDQIIDAANPDPRPHIKDGYRAVVERVFAGIREDTAQAIVPSRLDRLARQVAEMIEADRPVPVSELLADLEADLRQAVQRERTVGSLKPPTNGVEERLGMLEAHGYGPKEQDHARQMIVAERLERVDFFVLTTNRRTITRDELRAFGRPVTWTNDASWNAQFVSDRDVREMQAEAAKRERDAARGPWADNVNTDFGPRGIRQP